MTFSNLSITIFNMLTLKLVTDKNEISNLYKDFSIEDNANGVHFLFLDDEKPIGFIRFILKDNYALIDRIYYVDGVEEGDKDFFLRSTLFKFQDASILLKLEGDQKDFYKFGFVYEDGYTQIWSPNINLHGGCSSHN